LRKALTILFVLLFAGSLMAQVRTGNLYGKVTDEDGNPLPGVTVTLSGARTAPLTSISSAEGIYRFLSLPPARDYVIRCELGGFKLEERTGIIVVVGANIELNVIMTMGAIEEEVTVTAVSPVVDTKKTAVGQNVTQDVLQSLPTARDPWVVLQMAPSIMVDRENIGGVESGQQSNYVARGAGSYSNNVWAMDGIVITDPAAIGASPSYYDFDAFEEMQITVGGADVTIQTGGVALNMVTRRGGNKITLGGRFYMVDSKFQAKNEEYVAETKETERYFEGINLINNNKDYGFNLGGPLVKDKTWLWGSYGVQDIKTTTVFGTRDDTLLVNYAAKLNVQIIPENRFEAFLHSGAKNKWGRSTSTSNPEGEYQGGRYHFGSPVLKFQDEHMFGDNLFVSLKYAFSDAGFNLTPMTDLDFEKPTIWDVKDQRYYGSQSRRYYVERPVNQYNLILNYFNDALFGVSHDIKVGFEYADRNAYTESVRTGNMRYLQHYDTDTVDWDAWDGSAWVPDTGDGLPDLPPTSQYEDWKRFEFWRGTYRDYGVSALAAYASDTITFGRFNLLLGLRYDKQRPKLNPVDILAYNDNPAWDTVVDSETQSRLDALLPAVTIEGKDAIRDDGSAFMYSFFSPRVGLTWDATGDGKTIAKASFAMYGDFMGTGSWNQMPGGSSGWIDFWWQDDGDNIVNYSELYWHYRNAPLNFYEPYRVFDDAGNFIGDNDVDGDGDNWSDAAGGFWGGFDSAHPLALTDPYGSYDNTVNTSRTMEAMLTLEREIFTDFSATVNLTYRKYDHWNWSAKYFVDAEGERYCFENRDWYIVAPNRPPQTIDLTDVETMWDDGNTGEAPGHDWYYLDPNYQDPISGLTMNPGDYSPWWITSQRPGRYNDFYGIDIIFNKRLSNRWMFNGSLTWQHQEQHYKSEGIWDPTNVWAVDGRAYAPFIGGASGKLNQYIYSRWLVKAGGLYQLPYDINVSFTFLAREGWPIQETFEFYDYTLQPSQPRDYTYTSYIQPFGTDRLNTFYRFDLRLEKVLTLGDTGRIYLMADLFNVFNSKLENRRNQKTWGRYYYYGAGNSRNWFRPDVDAYALNEILNPRVVRFGVRFQF